MNIAGVRTRQSRVARAQADSVQPRSDELDSLSDREFELLKLTMSVSYEDARARLNSAISIADAGLKGLLALNGAGIATVVTVLGLRADGFGSQLAKHIAPDLHTPLTLVVLGVLVFLLGVGLAAVAVRNFSLSNYSRGDFELAIAEDLLHRFLPRTAGPSDMSVPGSKMDRRERLATSFASLSLVSFVVGSLLCTSAGLNLVSSYSHAQQAHIGQRFAPEP